jgi:hypothetical protein
MNAHAIYYDKATRDYFKVVGQNEPGWLDIIGGRSASELRGLTYSDAELDARYFAAGIASGSLVEVCCG